MTTLDQYARCEFIFQKLDEVRARRWNLRVIAAALGVVTVAMLSLLAMAAGAGYFADQPPAMLRWALLAGGLSAVALATGWLLVRSLFWRQNPAQTARFVEQALPQLHNDLINTVLLSGDNVSSAELVKLAYAEAVERSATVDMTKSVPTRSLWRWGIVAAVAAVVLGAFAFAQPRAFKRGLLAVFSPRAYVPAMGAVELVSLTPGDATVFAGEPITVTLRVRNDDAGPLKAQIIIDGGEPQPMLSADGNSRFTWTCPSVDQAFRYAVRVGDSRWPEDKPSYTVTVRTRVDLAGMEVEYTCPDYTGIKPAGPKPTDGTIEAPIGSRARLTVKLSDTVPAARISIKGAASAVPVRAASAVGVPPSSSSVSSSQQEQTQQQRAGKMPAALEGETPSSLAMIPGPDGKSFWGDIPVVADGHYQIMLLDNRGQAIGRLPDPGNGGKFDESYRIHAIGDDPPKIDFLSPGRDIDAAPGAKVALRVHVSDQYGISEVKFFAGREGAELKAIKPFGPARFDKAETAFDYVLDLSAYKKNDVVVYYAQATDNRQLPGIPGGGGAQTTASRMFKITVQDAAELAAEKAKRFEELRKRLAALLQLQETQRVSAEIVVRKHVDYVAKPAPLLASLISTTSEEVSRAQRDIRTELVNIVEKFPFDQDTSALQPELATLANNDAATAVEQARAMAAMKLTENIARQGLALNATQDRIIDSLRTLLAIMPTLANKKDVAEKPTSRPTELPADAADKLRQLKSDMEKFAAEQKKIIEATNQLSKKPADQFTPEDQKLLADLKASEDKWEKFLNQAFQDFSKLAQQDFSNPVLMKELLSIKSDITMAKDALSKKATEIATAMEDNGVENAESLTTNIEKWLSDKPDREKWQMEAMGDQMNVEAAELPKELEDLVGDLLEQEEDLFQEMQDSSAKSTGSFDKGVGWDAVDGPISSMNAQGVTGNQLPNDNELQGRSGEGRTGKSGGEFVEDKAVGKGGRRTPTRLDEGPFQKGEVATNNDDPAGGATGGGKLAGAGGEGLQGPVPPDQQKELGRLAGKQAALMNKAERLSGQFDTNSSANVKMLQAITLMNKVRRDLDDFRYTNALRNGQQTVAALKQSKMLLTGQVDVSVDTTQSMPKYILDDIADSMNGSLPEEYSDVLKEYYKRLSHQGQN